LVHKAPKLDFVLRPIRRKTVKNLEKLAVALTLLLVFVVPGIAGETQSPPCAIPGEMNSPPCAGGNVASDVPTELGEFGVSSDSVSVSDYLVPEAVDFVQSVLALF
jgi:hypothetical protein